jgi:hypothetical protein
MKKIIVFIFLLFNFASYAQDSLTLERANQLRVNETLIIDFENSGCRVNSGDRFKINRINDSVYIYEQYVDFFRTIYLDGEEVKDNNVRAALVLGNGANKRIEKRLTQGDYTTFMAEIEKIISSNNTDQIIIAGDSSTLSLQIGDLKMEKEFKGWLSIEHN